MKSAISAIDLLLTLDLPENAFHFPEKPSAIPSTSPAWAFRSVALWEIEAGAAPATDMLLGSGGYT